MYHAHTIESQLLLIYSPGTNDRHYQVRYSKADVGY